MISHRRPLERLRAGLAGVAGRLRRDERGAIAVQFAFLALPITILAFGLLDMNRISVQRRQLQDALDAATLIAARSTATTDAALDTTGDAAFLAEMTGLGVTLTAANSTFKAGRATGSSARSPSASSRSSPTCGARPTRRHRHLGSGALGQQAGSGPGAGQHRLDGQQSGLGRHQDRRPDHASKDLVDTLYAAAARASRPTRSRSPSCRSR
jgi:Flp pilus assembly protein TadG